MEKIVESLMRIEKAADAAQAKFNEERSRHPETIESEIKKIKREINEKTEMAIERLRAESEAETESEIISIGGRYEAASKKIEEAFTINGDSWIETIIGRILCDTKR
ncbi:MAG: hypothetical protein FWF03_02710 [Defluviitaleaceae bacterium]|nr:hypothetical protein [Defluviitaleaceae bacterium]